MARTITQDDIEEAPSTLVGRTPHEHVHNYTHEAYSLLRWGFAALPIIVGVDKFFNVLTNWGMYLAPQFTSLAAHAGLTTAAFLQLVGVFEIAAGLLVAIKPRFGAYVVAAWLLGVALNFVLAGTFYDAALRDAGLALGAVALGRLSERFNY